MPLWGSESDVQELMRRHEAEGLGAFELDDSEFGRLFVETLLPGGERCAAPCGCAVTIPAPGDVGGPPTFHPTDVHLEWAEPTDRERSAREFLRTPVRRRRFRRG